MSLASTPPSTPWQVPERLEVQIIDFGQIGGMGSGYLTVAQSQVSLPFTVRRVFWTYGTPTEVVRGQHAHYRTEQVLIAVAGRIDVTLEFSNGEVHNICLDRPQLGVYIPPYAWHIMHYSHDAIQLALASLPYAASDYIRDKQKWRETYQVNRPR